MQFVKFTLMTMIKVTQKIATLKLFAAPRWLDGRTDGRTDSPTDIDHYIDSF